MTTLEALAIRINEIDRPGRIPSISAEQLEHIVQALAHDEDARLLFNGEIDKRRPRTS